MLNNYLNHKNSNTTLLLVAYNQNIGIYQSTTNLPLVFKLKIKLKIYSTHIQNIEQHIPPIN